MYKIKNLKWKTSQGEQEALVAKPSGLQWHYCITPQESEQYSLDLLDSYYEYAPGFPKTYTSIKKAKQKANEHYISVVGKLLAK